MSEGQLSVWGGQTGGDIITEIERSGFALVEHGIRDEHIDAMLMAHANFTDNHPDPEPATMNAMIRTTKDLDKLDFYKDRQPTWHKYRTNTPHFAKPNGYTNRTFQAQVLRDERGLDIVEDPKEFFHYTPGMKDAVKARHEEFGWGPVPPEALELMTEMQRIHFLARTAMAGLFAKLEDANPGLAKYTTKEDLLISPIRGLYYHKTAADVPVRLNKDGDRELAGGHKDRGLFTMQIAESHLGLRNRNPETGKMDRVIRAPQYGVTFPAEKWKHAFPDSGMRPLWHDVIDIPELNEGRRIFGKKIVRAAIIYFINSRKIGDQVNKEATHTEEERLVA